VKISGAYRSSKLAPTIRTWCRTRVRYRGECGPRRLGTTGRIADSAQLPGRKATDIAPFYPIDDGRLLNQLPAWAPDAMCAEKSGRQSGATYGF